MEQIKEISERSEELVEKLFEESKKLENFVAQTDKMQTESIDEFKKAYEVIMLRQHALFGRWLWLLSSNMGISFFSLQEQSKFESEKLIADMTSLVSDHIRRQIDLVSSWHSFLFYFIFITFGIKSIFSFWHSFLVYYFIFMDLDGGGWNQSFFYNQLNDCHLMVGLTGRFKACWS